MKKYLKIMALATALALLAGCSQNQVVATLEASVSAAEVVVQTLASTGKIPPEAAQAIEGAIADLPEAYEQTAVELGSADSDAVKAVKIAGDYASTLAALDVVPASARAYAAAIAATIRAFLATLAQAPVQAAHASPRAMKAAKYDPRELASVAGRAGALGVQLAGLKAAQGK